MMSLMPVGPVNSDDAELGHRAAAHFGEADAQQHLVAPAGRADLEQRDELLFALDEAAGEARHLVGDVLRRDDARQDDGPAVGPHVDRFPGEELLELCGQPREIALHDDLVPADGAGRDPTRTSRWCPAVLPLTSSSFGDVTSASATSALVSDTRAIGLPTSTMVERPTSRRTESVRRLDCGRRLDGARRRPSAGVGACAYSVERPTTDTMKIKAPINRRPRLACVQLP